MTLDEYDTICAERSELSEAVQNVRDAQSA